MRTCDSCQQHNPDDAQFCLRCGTAFPREAEETASPKAEYDAEYSAGYKAEYEGEEYEGQYWRTLVGPRHCLQFTLRGGWSWKPAWDYYQRMFQRFSSVHGPRFALTWNWAPFLVEPFLWFLYRKMYMFAFVYFIGPMVSVFLTGDITVPIVWSIIAGASANYVYYWHLKDQLRKVNARAGPDHTARMRGLADEGGVQPYVSWLVAALILLKIGISFAVLGEPPPEEDLPLPGGEEMEGRQTF